MTTKPRGSTLPAYTFALIPENIAAVVITSGGSLAAKDSWALVPGGLAPYNAAPVTALAPQTGTIKGQNATAAFASVGGDLVLSPGTGSGGNVSGNVIVKDTAGLAGWNTSHLIIGVYHLWVDGSGRLRIKVSAPTGDTDGTVVGTQV